MANNNGTHLDLNYKFQCKGCGQQIVAELPPPDSFLIANHPLVSSITLPHEKPTICPHCSISYALVIVGLQPQFRYEPFEKKSESGIIIPSGPVVPFKKPNLG